jgi:hypothetical protein
VSLLTISPRLVRIATAHFPDDAIKCIGGSPPLAAITLNASTSVETSLFNIDHIQRTINSYAVNLKYRLRNIKTNRANLAHGRLPSCGLLRRNTPWHFNAAEWAPFHASTTDITLIQA